MKDKIKRLVSKIDLMVLGLVLEKPMHGYEINQIISSNEMQSWLDISRTSVYYALTRLKKQGLINEVVEKQHNKPDRSIYRITEAGRDVFFNTLTQSLAEQEKVFLDYNISLFFINKLSKEKALDILEKRKKFLYKWKSTLRTQLEAAHNDAEYPSTLKAVLDHTLAFADGEITWFNNFVERIDDASIEPSGSSVFSLNGNLAVTQLADIVRLIASGGRTGTLSLQQGLDQVAVSFENGDVRYVTGSYGLSSANSEAAGIPGEVLRAFNWPEGTYTFIPDKIIQEGGMEVQAESCALIFAGSRYVDDWNRIRKVIPSTGTVYELSGMQKKPLAKIPLSIEERAVLNQINGMRDVERIAASTRMSIFDVSRVLYVFIVCGIIVPTNRDMCDLFNLVKLFTDSFFERLVAIKAENIAEEIQEDLNNLSLDRRMPFILRDFKLEDTVSPPKDLKEFADYSREFCGKQVEAVRSQLGVRFAGHVMDSIIGQLTPESHDIYSRHGFDTVMKLKPEGK